MVIFTKNISVQIKHLFKKEPFCHITLVSTVRNSAISHQHVFMFLKILTRRVHHHSKEKRRRRYVLFKDAVTF
jgi:hypothetical protein